MARNLTSLTLFATATALSAGLTATGCAARPHHVEDPYEFGDPQTHVVAPPRAQVAALAVVTPRAERCAVPGDVVYFEFDSADLMPPARAELSRLASCLRGSPETGLALDIVGRADPRGTDPYNYQLGLARADTVARYLLVRGVPADHVSVRSRGEEGTSPDEPWKFSTDRRVAVRLQDSSSAVISAR